MTVFFRKSRGLWFYEFQIGQVRYSRACRDKYGNPVTTKRAALDAEAEAKRQAKMETKAAPAGEITFAEVMNALCEGWQLRPGWDDKAPMVRELLEFFGPETPMRAIDGAKIDDYITFALTQPVKIWRGGPSKTPGALVQQWKDSGRTRSPARVNRYLPLLRAAFDRAHKTRDTRTGERVIRDIPAIKDLAETKRKARPVPERVLERVTEILPTHVIDGLIITLCCGFRRNEAFSLIEPQIDWEAQGVRLRGEEVKDSEDVFLPVSQFAIGYLRSLSIEADERRTRHLITFRQSEKEQWRPIKSPKTAWRRAMRIIMEEFGARWRWHDVRAAFITKVALESGPLAAQKLARHSDFKTTQAYIEVADEVMREAAEKATSRPTLSVIGGGKK